MKDIIWNAIVIDEMRDLGGVTTDELYVMHALEKGRSIVEISMALNISETKVSRLISSIRAKYDALQPYSLVLEPRRKPTRKRQKNGMM